MTERNYFERPGMEYNKYAQNNSDSSADDNSAIGILATAIMFSVMVVIAEEVGSWINDKDDIKDPSIEKVVVNDSVLDNVKAQQDVLLLNIKSPNCR